MAMAGTDSGFRSRYACAEPGMTICMGRAETSFSCFDRHPGRAWRDPESVSAVQAEEPPLGLPLLAHPLGGTRPELA